MSLYVILLMFSKLPAPPPSEPRPSPPPPPPFKKKQADLSNQALEQRVLQRFREQVRAVSGVLTTYLHSIGGG